MAGMQTPKDEVYSLTSARRPLSEDQGSRQRRYMISMAIRTVCFVLAVIVDGPLRWVLLVGAVLLPYIAVLIANAGRESGSRQSGGGVVQPGVLPARMLTDAPHVEQDR